MRYVDYVGRCVGGVTIEPLEDALANPILHTAHDSGERLLAAVRSVGGAFVLGRDYTVFHGVPKMIGKGESFH